MTTRERKIGKRRFFIDFTNGLKGLFSGKYFHFTPFSLTLEDDRMFEAYSLTLVVFNLGIYARLYYPENVVLKEIVDRADKWTAECEDCDE